ncbi:uncharacterized protein BYT42DRAFT_616738 [Radiomyces spectabilis]|uniref:uncharacterized protein n=1 Tax=Radiomyces spectabilis TaxID=64574 RepID=UPI0022204686|nr:uncharacterized protein BYT42DRAFT_616738 [Radiomyces spectabilis]KAI8371666.1 hypothetical protein BYT42DRAFT_616738 [Radiomyces spectabilis]
MERLNKLTLNIECADDAMVEAAPTFMKTVDNVISFLKRNAMSRIESRDYVRKLTLLKITVQEKVDAATLNVDAPFVAYSVPSSASSVSLAAALSRALSPVPYSVPLPGVPLASAPSSVPSFVPPSFAFAGVPSAGVSSVAGATTCAPFDVPASVSSVDAASPGVCLAGATSSAPFVAPPPFPFVAVSSADSGPFDPQMTVIGVCLSGRPAYL